MKKYVVGAFCIIISIIGSLILRSNTSTNKIIKAKNMVKYLSADPESVIFDESYTRVEGNVVSLKFNVQTDEGDTKELTLDLSIDDY